MTPTIELFFDVASAYSYLASTQMDALAARTGAAVRWRPFLLGAVFKATENEMPARIPAKARYMVEDLKRWAAHYRIEMALPSRFPLVTLRPQRALAHVEITSPASVRDLAIGLFRAYWVEDRDVSSDEVVASVAWAAGLDGGAVVAGIDRQETKDRLRATTDEAVARGAFGAPALFVGDALFWGNDRLGLLEEHLRRG
jgi:2-hydroxychromene-2-carboxylate isomerase